MVAPVLIPRQISKVALIHGRDELRGVQSVRDWSVDFESF